MLRPRDANMLASVDTRHAQQQHDTDLERARLFDALRAPDSRFQAICKHLTLDTCAADPLTGYDGHACDDVHFMPIIYPHTDPSRGHCSYLNTCHRNARCRYLHFTPIRRPGAPPFVWTSLYGDPMPRRTLQPQQASGNEGNLYGYSQAPLADDEQRYVEAPIRHPARALHANGLDKYIRHDSSSSKQQQPLAAADVELVPAQWLDANLKTLDYSILGKFDVIVADPPWDIHMSLPYETMTDNDMRAMPIPLLQDEGFLFLWVTGRAMELGRELLAVWGYTRVDEIIWIKVGQTQRLIRTGRTGHWLNHTKEHCLVGVKTSRAPAVDETGQPARLLPSWANTGIDADVIVAEVRDTSRKPDELYGMIERLCPRGKKIELFGRRHNARPGWLTVGNQLKGDNLVDEALQQRVAAWRQGQQAM